MVIRRQAGLIHGKDAVQQVFGRNPGRGPACTIPDQLVHCRWWLGITGFMKRRDILKRKRDNPGEIKLINTEMIFLSLIQLYNVLSLPGRSPPFGDQPVIYSLVVGIPFESAEFQAIQPGKLKQPVGPFSYMFIAVFVHIKCLYELCRSSCRKDGKQHLDPAKVIRAGYGQKGPVSQQMGDIPFQEPFRDIYGIGGRPGKVNRASGGGSHRL